MFYSSFFFRDNSLNFSLLIGTSSTFWDTFSYPLYPYGFDDFIFIIYQRGKLKDEAPRSSLKPIAQWFALIFIASLLLYILRIIIKRRKRRISARIISDTETDEYFMFSAIDSVGVFWAMHSKKLAILELNAGSWFRLECLDWFLESPTPTIYLSCTPNQVRIASLQLNNWFEQIYRLRWIITYQLIKN